MNYKLEGALRRNRKYFIICGILWIFIAIVFVAPVAYSKFIAGLAESSEVLETFITTFITSIMHPLQTFGKIFEEGAIGDYVSSLLIVSILYLLFFFIGIYRSAPKNEYSDIEHGSSDWSKRGEQYQVLSKDKGIILAENNYLPVDKRGNVNVLVVGRFWFW